MSNDNLEQTNKYLLLISEEQVKNGALSGWLKDRLVPLELEVGTGQGWFICRLAKNNPGTKFIGLDLNLERCVIASDRAYRLGLLNLRIVNMEGHEFIRDFVLSNSLKAVHIYFPTPYPNAIGRTERLVSDSFLEEVYRVLMSGGSLRLVTDHREYYDDICGRIRRMLWWNMAWHPPIPPRNESEIVGTPCESVFGTESRPLELHLIK